MAVWRGVRSGNRRNGWRLRLARLELVEFDAVEGDEEADIESWEGGVDNVVAQGIEAKRVP